MPRHPQHQQPSPPVSQAAPAEPTTLTAAVEEVIRELPPVRVEHTPLETIDLAPDPAKAVDQPIIGEPEVVVPRTNPVSIDERPLSTLTREELMERLNAINASTRVSQPLN